jgi:hypothetical protein
MGKFQDLTGQKFNKITILKVTNKRTKDKRIVWLCQCDCGKKLLRTAKDLKSGHTKSCGCYRDYLMNNKNPNTRHSYRYHPLYKKLMDMKARCYNPNNKRYNLYGQKGIKICNQWLIPKNFIEWALNNGWQVDMTIDRIDSNKDYCPENCQWLSKSEHSIKTNITRCGKDYVRPKS